MPVSLSTVSAITKEIYTGKVQTQIQDETIAIKRIEQSSEGVTSEVGGKYVTFPIKVGRNQGIGYRNELEQLQNPGQGTYAAVRVGLKYGYGRLRISGQTMELVSTNTQAFASAMDLEIQGLKDDLLKDTNRIVYGDSSGVLATTAAPGTGATAFICDTIQYMDINGGMVVDIVNSAGTVKSAANTITAVNVATKTVTLGTAATWVAGDFLVRTGNVNREPNGFRSIITATGTLFNVDPTVVPQWKAIVDSNGGTNRALSEGLMIANVDAARLNGGKTSLLLTTLGVRRSYFNLLTTQRRFTGTQEFAGGYKGLAFAAGGGRDIPIIEDPDCTPNTIYGIDETSFKVYRDHDWEFIDRDGSMWKWVRDFDAYEAVMSKYWELATNRRNANFKIADVTES